ncbi:TonB-dependent receptor [Tsuneonella mangrovi]|uniref:TonB-dependent receptor n=1 Tax=Tsuneonella mangrovi TaxID=1982042 RepID=UPI00196ACDC9|nr:TonB-dependent receptor [Tsuneonella mangrovi]
MSVATLPLMLAAMPAHAQSTDDASTVAAKKAKDKKEAAAKKKAEATASASAQGTGAAETTGNTTGVTGETASDGAIVVSGIRASLTSSQSIKKNADQIVDAIVAEDIGKLPDNTAAETIARIAGVQVVRYNDEASQVLIRGLPDVATTYNGREIFTAELRRVQLQDFPSQAISAIEVYKSGSADQVEAGLAGLVNVRTRRPLDFKGMVIAGGIHGTYNDQSRKFDPDYNLLFSDRWQAGDGEMGFLANVTFAQSQYYNGVRYNSTWIRDDLWSDFGTQGNHVRDGVFGSNDATGLFYFPNNIGIYNEHGRRYRPSANFSFQWDPNPDTDIYVEGIYQGFRGRGQTDNVDVPLELWGPNGTPPVFTNVVLKDGQSYSDTAFTGPGAYDPNTVPQAASLTKTSGSEPQGWRRADNNYTNTFQIASGASWRGEQVKLSTDFAYSWSEYRDDSSSLDWRATGADPLTVDAAFAVDGGVSFNFPNWNQFDPTTYLWRGYYQSVYWVRGSGWQWRGDMDWDTGSSFLSKVQVGVRLTERKAAMVENYARYAYTMDLGIPYTDLPIGELSKTLDPFRGNAQGFTQWLSASGDSIYTNKEALRQYSYNALLQLQALYPQNDYSQAIQDWSTPDVQAPSTSGWRAKENTWAGYAQGHYNFDVGTLQVDGLLGIRAVLTDGHTFGTSSVCLRNFPNSTTDFSCTQTLTPRTERQNYLDWLPNASMRIKFTDKLQLRLGWTYTRTKPDFAQLNPALQIYPVSYSPCGVPTDPNYDPTDITSCRHPGTIYPSYSGSQGNPELKPFTSKNYDASLEWYFSRTGYASAAVFYHDIYGFTTNVTRYKNDPVYGVLQLSTPINAGDASIKGFELNLQSFLDFLPSPWNGFGVQANLTYLEGKSRYPNGYDPNTDTFTGPGEYLKIPGLSKWTYNLTGFYEKGPIQARISYNWRSSWVSWYNLDPQTGNQYTGGGVYARSRLDASFSVKLTKNFTVNADVSNILAKPFHDYVNYKPGGYYTQDIRDEGRYYGLALRWRFGE